MKQESKPYVVIDTNILVSSLLSKDGAPAKLISMGYSSHPIKDDE